MKPSDASHLSDTAIRVALRELTAQDRTTTARMLVYLAEFDSRRLYLEAAHPSTYAYCLGELGMSEDVAYKRIRAARAARRFPRIFGSIADGGLTLSAVVLLAPHLTEATAEELLEAAARKTNEQIEQLLARRFPRPDLPPLALPAAALPEPSAPPEAPEARCQELAVRPVEAAVSPPPAPRPRVQPLAPGRYGIQFMLGQEGWDLLQQAQDLS